MPRPVAYAFGVFAMGVLATTSCCTGVLIGEGRECKQRCDEQRDELLPVLASDPAFSGVVVDDTCDGGWVILTGEVKTSFEQGRLRERVTRIIGERRAEYAVSFVRVR